MMLQYDRHQNQATTCAYDVTSPVNTVISMPPPSRQQMSLQHEEQQSCCSSSNLEVGFVALFFKG